MKIVYSKIFAVPHDPATLPCVDDVFSFFTDEESVGV